MNKLFLSCDWGTSSFRLRLADTVSAAVLAESVGTEGIGSVYAAWQQSGTGEEGRLPYFLAVLQRHIAQIRQQVNDNETAWPVVISGMASSTIGMLELPYTQVPFAADGRDILVKKLVAQPGFGEALYLVSGARTSNDVMRGEETQLMGAAAGGHPGLQLFVFPGTHSKHITVMDNRVTGFRTFMTGEIFQVLCQHTLLAAGIDIAAVADEKESSLAFEQGVLQSAGQPLLHALFLVRTNQLFKKFSRAANAQYLSGLLVGAEINELPACAAHAITLVGEEALVSRYKKALQVAGSKIPLHTMDAGTATTRGQLAIYRRHCG